MKKFISLCAVVVSLAIFSLTAFAATGINANEQAILDALSQKVTLAHGGTIYIPEQDVAQAKSYMSRSDVDINKADSDKIIALINESRDLTKKDLLLSKGTSLAQLSFDVKSVILANGQECAKIAGASLTYNPANNMVTIKDNDGNVIFETGAVIKTTGTDATGAILLTLAVLSAVGAAAVVYRKKALHA